MDIELIMEHLKTLSNEELDIIKKDIDKIYHDRYDIIFLSKLSHIKKLLSDYEELGLDNDEVPSDEYLEMLKDIDDAIVEFIVDLLHSGRLIENEISAHIKNSEISSFIGNYERYQTIEIEDIIEYFIIDRDDDEYLYLSNVILRLNMIEYIYNNNLGSVTRDW